MIDTQILTIALSTAPTMLLVLVGILINNARLGDTNTRIGELRSHIDVRFEEMKDLWRSELHRVEEVIDARLRHIEGR
jgi:cell division protein FtsL